MVEDEELVEALSRDHREASLQGADRAMLDFVAKLTKTPAEMQSGDVDSLREAGFADRAIHDMVLVAGYFAFVNRVADGLGVELEARWSEESP